MINHYDNPRSIQVEFDYQNKPLPYWATTEEGFYAK